MAELLPHEAPARDMKDLPLMNPGKPIGRDDLLREVYTYLRAGQAVLLNGPSGVGKTTLAATLAAIYTQQPGGVLWLDAADATLSSLLVRVGRAYNLTDVITSENPTSLVGSVAGALMRHKPFIVLENVDSPQAAALFLDKCASGLPMILLSEQAFPGKWSPVTLPLLDDANSVTLFKQKAGMNDASEDADVLKLVRMLGGLPLALVIAARGKFAAKQSTSGYLKILEQVSAAAGDNAVGALATSYRTLSNPLQGLVLMLGATFRGEASDTLLSLISGAPIDAINQSMIVLARLYLAEEFERGGHRYYRMHPFVHDFAQKALQGSNRLETLQNKVLDTIVQMVKTQSTAGSSGHALLALEIENIIAAARYAVQKGQRDVVNGIVVGLTQADGFIQKNGYVHELLLLRDLSAGTTTAFPAYQSSAGGVYPDLDEDEDDEFDDLDEALSPLDTLAAMGNDDLDEDEDDDNLDHGLAGIDDDFDEDESFYEDGEDFEDSRQMPALKGDHLSGVDVDQLRVALAQAKQQRDLPRQMQILKAIGKVQVKQEKTNEAITTYNEVLALHETVGDDEGTLETLDMLSALLVKSGESPAAVMHATRGVTLADVHKDRETKTHLLLTLGDARQEQGEADAAMKAYSQALELTRELGDRQSEAIALYKLGYAYLDKNDTEQALHSLEQARELFKTQGRRSYEGRVLGALGTAYSDLERWAEAMNYFRSALYIAREVTDRPEEALQLSNLARAQVEAKQLPDALISYRQALHLAYASGDDAEIVSTIVDLVELMQRSPRLLDICDLLLRDALAADPHDRDLQRLQEEVNVQRTQAAARGVVQAQINGTGRDYAANAYALLEA